MKRGLLFVVVAFAIACGGTKETSPPHVPPTLRPVSLPDVSNAAEAVQSQLRARYASLTKVRDDPATPVAVLASSYGEMGKVFIAAEYFDGAQACFENAQTLAPSEMRWPYYLAHVFRFKSDPVRASSAFERALVLQPDHVPSLVWLAELHLASNRPDQAAALLMKAESLQPMSGAVLYGLGRVSLAKQEYAPAVAYLEKALAMAPAATRVHYPLAMAYRGLGNRTMADTHLRQRGDVDLPPADPLLEGLSSLLENAALYLTRGGAAMNARQWPDAVVNFRKAVELAPDDPSTQLNLATSLYMTDSIDEALDHYRAAIRLSPGLAKAHFGLGVLMQARGRDREAIEAFAAAVQAEPGYLEARYTLADALRRSGRVSESLTHYEEVLRVNPAISQASFGYAMGLVRLGRYQEARDRLERDTKAFPGQPGFPHALARLLAAAPDDRVRNGARALTLLRPLLESQRTLGLTETMAMALAEVGRFDEASTWQREALEYAKKAGPADVIARLEVNLRLYDARQPCRTPWTNDDPVHHPRPAAN